MFKLIRSFFFAVLWIATLGIVTPFLESSLYAVQLAAKPVPAALPMPVPGIGRGVLQDSWHAARSGGRRHEGIDLFSGRGTPVRATTEGIVLRRSQNRLGGNVVWVLGPGGHRHYYAHLERFADVAAGQRILPGTILGFVGNSGNARSTPPHLHYGIYGTAGAINPFPFLARGAPGDRHRIKRPGR